MNTLVINYERIITDIYHQMLQKYSFSEYNLSKEVLTASIGSSNTTWCIIDGVLYIKFLGYDLGYGSEKEIFEAQVGLFE